MKRSLATRLLLLIMMFSAPPVVAQTDTCIFSIRKHSISSAYLKQQRPYWVSLPMQYDASKSYPVLYVLDAEWRFDLVRAIAYDLAGNKKMPHHIIVGIPHLEWDLQRGRDLTFSHSRVEYDGEAVDSSWYTPQNSGGGMQFFNFLSQEVMADVAKNYATNGFNVLVGHSYGGYFATYIAPLQHSFSALQIYDPSIWYSNGEAIQQIKEKLPRAHSANIYISLQSEPAFHATKIKELVQVLSAYPGIRLAHKEFSGQTHNSLFMYSFIAGMEALYNNTTALPALQHTK